MGNLGISSVGVEFGSAEFLLLWIQKKSKSACSDPLNLYHSHCFYEIHAVTENSAVFLLENSKVTVNKGEIIIIGCDEPHISNFGNKAKTSVISLMLKCGGGNDGFYAYYSKLIDNAVDKAIKLPEGLFEEIIRFGKLSKEELFSGFARIKSEAYRIMADFFECIQNGDENAVFSCSGLSCEEELVILQELINDSNMTISEISDAVKYSQRHTSRLILKYFGKSLAEIRRERMATTEMKLNEIFPDEERVGNDG